MKRARREEAMAEKMSGATAEEVKFASALHDFLLQVKGWYYEMEGAAQACVTRCCELAGTTEGKYVSLQRHVWTITCYRQRISKLKVYEVQFVLKQL